MLSGIFQKLFEAPVVHG